MAKSGKKEATARKRAEVIMKVRCGLMTASQAARILGVSRKTYYKWEQRGLAAMLSGVEDQSAGRPGPTDERLREAEFEDRLAELQHENTLLKQKVELKDLLSRMEIRSAPDRSKKK